MAIKLIKRVSLQRSIYCYDKVLKSIICSSCIKTEDIKYNVDIWFVIIKKYFHCFFTGFTLGWFSLVLFTTFIQVYGVPYTHTHALRQTDTTHTHTDRHSDTTHTHATSDRYHTHTHRHWFSLQPFYRYTVYHTHTDRQTDK